MTPQPEPELDVPITSFSEAKEMNKEGPIFPNESGEPLQDEQKKEHTGDKEVMEDKERSTRRNGRSSTKQNGRKGRRKRGISLERDISELIRGTALATELNVSNASAGKLPQNNFSAAFILRDLEQLDEVSSQDTLKEAIPKVREGEYEGSTQQAQKYRAEVLNNDSEAVLDKQKGNFGEDKEELGRVTSQKLEQEQDLHDDPSLVLALTEDDPSVSTEGDEEDDDEIEKTQPNQVITHVSIPENEKEESNDQKGKTFSDVGSFDTLSWKEEDLPEQGVPYSPMEATARQSPPPALSPGAQSIQSKTESVVFKTNFDDWSDNFDDAIDPAEFGANDFFANSAFDAKFDDQKAKGIQSCKLPNSRIKYRAASSWRSGKFSSGQYATESLENSELSQDFSSPSGEARATVVNKWNQRRQHQPITRVMI